MIIQKFAKGRLPQSKKILLKCWREEGWKIMAWNVDREIVYLIFELSIKSNNASIKITMGVSGMGIIHLALIGQRLGRSTLRCRFDVRLRMRFNGAPSALNEKQFRYAARLTAIVIMCCDRTVLATCSKPWMNGQLH